MLGQPWITECACEKLARDKSPLRSALEEKLILLVQKHFGTAEELNILSLRSRGCFQELVLHAKINKKINWILVDPIYKNSNHKTIKAFSSLTNAHVTCLEDDQAALAKMKEGMRPHIFLNIDSRLSKIHLIGEEKLQTKLEVFQEGVNALSTSHIWAILEDDILEVSYASQ